MNPCGLLLPEIGKTTTWTTSTGVPTGIKRKRILSNSAVFSDYIKNWPIHSIKRFTQSFGFVFQPNNIIQCNWVSVLCYFGSSSLSIFVHRYFGIFRLGVALCLFEKILKIISRDHRAHWVLLCLSITVLLWHSLFVKKQQVFSKKHNASSTRRPTDPRTAIVE